MSKPWERLFSGQEPIARFCEIRRIDIQVHIDITQDRYPIQHSKLSAKQFQVFVMTRPEIEPWPYNLWVDTHHKAAASRCRLIYPAHLVEEFNCTLFFFSDVHLLPPLIPNLWSDIQ